MESRKKKQRDCQKAFERVGVALFLLTGCTAELAAYASSKRNVYDQRQQIEDLRPGAAF